MRSLLMALLGVGVAAIIAQAQPLNGDLAMNLVTVTPSPASSGGSATVSWSVSSLGIAGGRGQVTRYEVRVPGMPTVSAQPLRIINNGSSANFSQVVTMPTVAVSTGVEVVVQVFGDTGFNQGNNTGSRFVTVQPPPQPNLLCWTPPNWSGPIVVANGTDATTSQSILVPDFPAFISYGIQNQGGNTPAGIPMTVRIDGVAITSPTPIAPLSGGFGTTVVNIPLPAGFLTPGSHTVTVVIDEPNLVPETNNSDNQCSRTFTVSPSPANDTCANATTIGVGATLFDTTFARTDGTDETLCAGFGHNGIDKDLWYRFAPGVAGTLTAETCGTSWDTRLAAYAQCPGGANGALQCNDDALPACAGNDFASRLTRSLTAGQSLLLRVGGYRDPQSGAVAFGAGTLTLAFAATPPTPCGPSDIASAGQVVQPDGQLTADDLILQINWFFASDPRADVASSGQQPGADGQFTADDLIVFVGRFFAGC